MKPVDRLKGAAGRTKSAGAAPPVARPAPKPGRSVLEAMGDPAGGPNFRRLNRMIVVAVFILLPVDYAMFKINAEVVDGNDGRVLSIPEAVAGAGRDVAAVVDGFLSGARTAAHTSQAAAHLADTGLHTGKAALARLPQAERMSQSGMHCAAMALGDHPGSAATCR